MSSLYLSDKILDKVLSMLKSNLDDVTVGSCTVYYAPDIPERIYDCAKTYFDCWETKEDILAVVDASLDGACYDGLIFSTVAIHYKDGCRKPENFSYSMIENMRVIGDELEIEHGITIASKLYKKPALKSLLEQILAAVNENAELAKAEADKLFNDIFGDRDLDNANLILEELETMSENIGKLQVDLEKALSKSTSTEDEENILKKLREMLADGQ